MGRIRQTRVQIQHLGVVLGEIRGVDVSNRVYLHRVGSRGGHGEAHVYGVSQCDRCVGNDEIYIGSGQVCDIRVRALSTVLFPNASTATKYTLKSESNWIVGSAVAVGKMLVL